MSFLLSSKSQRAIYIAAQLASILTLLLAITALVGFIYGIFLSFGVAAYTTMALHTALLFTMLSLGFLVTTGCLVLAPVFAADDFTGRRGLKALAFALITPILLGWLIHQGQQTGDYSSEFELILNVVANIFLICMFLLIRIPKFSKTHLAVIAIGNELQRANADLEQKVEARTEELKMNLLALKNSEQKFQSVTQSLKECIISTDLGGRIIFWNRAAEATFGYSEAEAQTHFITSMVANRYHAAYAHQVKKLPASTDTIEWYGVKKDGTEFPMDLSLTTWYAAEQCFVSVVIRDITEQKTAEAKIAEQQQMLIHSLKMKSLGEMASGIAHEINTPLTAICLRAAQAKHYIEEGSYHEAVTSAEAIDTTAFRIGQIIKGLQTFAHGGQGEPLKVVSIQSLIDDTLPLCQERFRHRGVAIRLAPMPDQLQIECRPIQTQQVLLNLLNNAFDATENLSEQWVEIAAIEISGWAHLSVTDSGKGISPELRPKIMQPFFTTKGIARGMGLGLSISKGIIESQNGRFHLDADSLRTRFVIVLPVASSIATSTLNKEVKKVS